MAGLAAQLRQGVMQDLEYAMRTKGGLTPEEERTLRVYKLLPATSFVIGSVFGTFFGWFGFDKGLNLFGLPPNPRFIRFCAAYGCACLAGKSCARASMYECPAVVLNTEEGRMKMELANMWHPRRSYIDSTFVERMEAVEAANSDDVARSISGKTNANTTQFGDLMEDSLACILWFSQMQHGKQQPPRKNRHCPEAKRAASSQKRSPASSSSSAC